MSPPGWRVRGTLLRVTNKFKTVITPTRKETRMNPPRSTLRRTAIAAALAATALAAAASPALAAPGYSISVSGPSTGSVGKTILLNVSGTNPTPEESWFNSYMEVNAIPAGVMPSCPTEYLQATQIAEASFGSGGDHLAGPQIEVRDPAGSWSAAVAFTPTAPGRMLICAYSENLTSTLAMTQHAINVQGGKAAGRKCKRAKGRAAAAARKCRKRR